MALKLQNIRENTRTVRVIIGGETLNLTINPGFLNQEVLDQYREASDEGDHDTMAHIFGNIVREWDLMEDDETVMAIDAETMRTLPTVVLNRVWDEIATLISPKSRKKNAN